jgi:putative lipoic acid-binding regulatory protein
MENNKLEYPRNWEFCIFGKNKEKMREAVDECIKNKIEHKDSKSHKSYHTQKVKVYVNSEDERNELYEKLKNHPEISYIL